jgi:polysaccharide biosynthesis protein PslF
VGVVRVVDGPPSSDPRVMAELDNGVPASLREATAALNGCDMVIVQHEYGLYGLYGLYGGTDGGKVLDILRALTVPRWPLPTTALTAPAALCCSLGACLARERGSSGPSTP